MEHDDRRATDTIKYIDMYSCKAGRPYIKFDFTVDEGKERPNPSREKNKGMHRRRKVGEKSCVTFLLCDPGWFIQRS